MIINNVPEMPVNNEYKNLKLAQAYVPYQVYRELFSADEALYKGTIFKELFRPYKRLNPYI